jgi:predicted nucleic acid-binding protein
MSSFQWDEMIRVLAYTRILVRSQSTPEEVATFAERLGRVAQMMDDHAMDVPQISTDAADSRIVHSAIEAKVDVICTLDRHILNPRVESYCGDRGIRILTDLQLLDELDDDVG